MKTDGDPKSRPQSLERLLTENEAARLLNLTPRALQAWRLRGGGPLFVRISGRAIRYRPSDLRAWIEQRIRASTSDPGNPSR